MTHRGSEPDGSWARRVLAATGKPVATIPVVPHDRYSPPGYHVQISCARQLKGGKRETVFFLIGDGPAAEFFTRYVRTIT